MYPTSLSCEIAHKSSIGHSQSHRATARSPTRGVGGGIGRERRSGGVLLARRLSLDACHLAEEQIEAGAKMRRPTRRWILMEVSGVWCANICDVRFVSKIRRINFIKHQICYTLYGGVTH